MQETIIIITENIADDKDSHFSKLHDFFPTRSIIQVAPGEAMAMLASKQQLVAAVVALDGYDAQDYLGLISAMLAASAGLPVILLLPYGEESLAQKALRIGVHDFLVKPVAMEKLKLSIQHAITISHMRRYIDRLERHISSNASITHDEKNSIMLSQMHSFLIDEKGDIKPLHILEQEIIRSVLRYSNGCVSRAARSLGIGRSTLYRKVDMIRDDTIQMVRATHTARPTISMSPRLRSSGE